MLDGITQALNRRMKHADAMVENYCIAGNIRERFILANFVNSPK